MGIFLTTGGAGNLVQTWSPAAGLSGTTIYQIQGTYATTTPYTQLQPPILWLQAVLAAVR
ncbi:MAG: hypothetical protein IPP29_22985 [Bacteroidetes bacterium]|nr:hypothetical protein [Bacteroidota bacterium]